MPAIISFNVNVPDDTPFVLFGLNPMTQQQAPLDANNNTSLRAVIEYANANPETGNWNLNHYEANLGGIASQTITLDPALGTLELESNFKTGATVTLTVPMGQQTIVQDP